jgi:pyrimidine operon attenuation protein/uracil phosphoribosyltransferase
MAEEIVELNSGTDNLIIVGIQRRGVQLADWIARTIREREDEARRGRSISPFIATTCKPSDRPVVGSD